MFDDTNSRKMVDILVNCALLVGALHATEPNSDDHLRAVSLLELCEAQMVSHCNVEYLNGVVSTLRDALQIVGTA